MKTVDKAEENIKYILTQMWQLVAKQITDSRSALVLYDKSLANEVVVRERIIDNYELQIDKCCEQFTALQNPVAIDLRFVLSHLKMNSNLERMADLAEGVSQYVLKYQSSPIDDNLYKVGYMLECVERMLELAYQAYLTTDTSLAFKVLALDTEVDALYDKAIEEISTQMANQPSEACRELVYLAIAIRRIERIGDRCTNLAENIIFHLDARQLKHAENIPTFDK